MNTVEFIESCRAKALLTDDQAQALTSACATKGKWKGCLRSECPKNGKAIAGWMAAMMHLSVHRTDMGRILADESSREIFLGLTVALSSNGIGPCLNYIEPQFRWNVDAMAYEENRSRIVAHFQSPT